MHFHLLGACDACLVRGNAIEFGQQRGVVIHGTHLATVEMNVLNDVHTIVSFNK